MKFKTNRIVFVGLFIAVSVILTRVLSFYLMDIIRISFGDIPTMIAGMLFGPFTGAVTGVLSDLVGVLIIPAPTGSAFFPGITISKMFVGIIPALAVRYLKGSRLFKIATGVILTEIVCSMILDTIWLSILLNKGILVLLPARLIARTIIMIAEVPIIYLLMERLKKANLLNNI